MGLLPAGASLLREIPHCARHPSCPDGETFWIDCHHIGAVPGAKFAEPSPSPINSAGFLEAKRKASSSGTWSRFTQLRTAVAMSRAAPAKVPSALRQRPSRSRISLPYR